VVRFIPVTVSGSSLAAPPTALSVHSRF
jgi:hypothetical protein